MPLAQIEWGKLGELLLVAPIASIVVGVTYGLLILGTARAGEYRRTGDARRAMGYGVLGAAGGLGFFGAVAFGLVVIIS